MNLECTECRWEDEEAEEEADRAVAEERVKSNVRRHYALWAAFGEIFQQFNP